MSDTERWVRFRALIDDYFLPIVVVALVVAVAGGYLTMTAYGQTETRAELRQSATWQSTGSFTHSATVINDTAVYSAGERLENKSSYFRTLTPQLDGSFVYTYTASGDGNLTGTATTTLVYRSVAESDDGTGVEYWRTAGELETEQATLSPGDRLTVPFGVNVTAASQRLTDIDAQFGGTPGTKDLYVETELTLTGTRNGQPVDLVRTYRLPITTSGNIYEVGGSGPFTESGNQTERVAVPIEPGPMRSYGGPALLVVGLVVAAASGGARYTGVTVVDARERDWLAYRDARKEFGDWITAASVPDGDTPDAPVEVASLEGLVDIAIDTDKRVIEDPDRGLFFLFGERREYVYEPPTAPTDASADSGDDDADDPLEATESAGGMNPFVSEDSNTLDETGSDTDNVDDEETDTT